MFFYVHKKTVSKMLTCFYICSQNKKHYAYTFSFLKTQTGEFMENFVNTFFDVKKKNDSARAR